MTLFWHNHFTSSFHKVKWPALLYRQNVLLRYHAVGSFRESIFQVAKDPYVTAKLWREFVSDQPDPTEVERLAMLFRNSGYQIKPLLSGLLTSPHFWAPESRGVLVKLPVELLAGTIRS